MAQGEKAPGETVGDRKGRLGRGRDLRAPRAWTGQSVHPEMDQGELEELAAELGVPGRGKMGRGELLHAVERARLSLTRSARRSYD